MDEPTRPNQASIVYPDFALHWAQKLEASVDSLIPLHGGINNQVFSCSVGAKSSKRFVIKGYSARGLTDRMLAEIQFLRYAQKVAPSYVPKLLAEDEQYRCVVLEYIDGQPYPVNQSPSEQDVMHAGRFFRLLNADQLLAKEYIKQSAAEGFLRVTEHLENVFGRLNQLSIEHLPIEFRSQANVLVQNIFQEFEVLADQTKALIDKGQTQDAINFEDCCVSPSDFGFHNALRSAGGVKFFDFEFAGWDDPAKAVVDFSLQPRMPVAPSLAKLFFQAVAPYGGEQLSARSAVLGPILRLKWLCIMLSVLRPDRLLQMKAVAQDAMGEGFVKQRLEEAQAYIDKEFSFGIH
ncbi:aminoglycoside phosphotransferase family protein [Polynucleobacter nymphae]|uniref:aminoglycoside phosphotransferase family protein n=1 Tax=Polynucleobacter nymphae TaxID=2081043 RepID=UPI001C0ADED3|nr:aminoglycoside phosphotransferase family protein [Polynucleobacter nymphae]MBU3607801.1 aminoglycoside phosphotransferase family protein [Polynucleobacter nymphae]